MSFLESLSSLLATKAAAGAAATGLAVAGAAGLAIATDRADDVASERLQQIADGELEDGALDADLVTDLTSTDDADGSGELDGTATGDVTVTEDDVTPTDEEEDGDDGHGRAADVHATLSGGEASPGDGRAFGEAVSARAREQERGSFGREVAATASQGRSEQGAERSQEARDRAPERDPDRPGADDDPGERPEPPATSGRPDGTPPEQGAASEDGLQRADEARQGSTDRPAGRP
jgi:hypothetical protein